MSSIEQPHRSGVSADPLAAPADLQTRGIIRELWLAKTPAELVTTAEFSAIKAQQGLHVIGVMGFSGQWSEAKIAADSKIGDDVSAATAVLQDHLTQLKSRFGSRLTISSGATMEGVPKIIYDLCEKLDIDAMGVTSGKAIDYALGKMKYLIVEGADWGEESPAFLSTADAFLILGGGGQAKREALAGAAEGKQVTVFQGFGGSADQLSGVDIPQATFVARH